MIQYLNKIKSSTNVYNTGIIILLVLWALITIHSIYGIGLLCTIPAILLVITVCIFYPEWSPGIMFIPMYAPWSGIGIPSPYITLCMIVGGIGIFKNHSFRGVRFAPLLIYAFYFVIVLAYASVGDYSNREDLLIRHFTDVIGFSIVVYLVRDRSLAWKTLHVAAIFSALFVVVSYFHYVIGWNNTYFGKLMLSQQGADAFVGKITLSNVDDTVRIMYAGVDPNFQSAYLLIGYCSSLFIWSTEKFKLISWPLLLVIFNALGIMGTYSRSAFIVMVLSALLFLIYHRKVTFGFVALASIVLLVAMYIDPVRERLLSIPENIIEKGGTGRANSFMNGLQLWVQNPFGMGLGMHRKSLPSESVWVDGGSHSSYIDCLVQFGLIGLFVLLCCLYVMYKPVIKRYAASSGQGRKSRGGLVLVVTFPFIFIATIPMVEVFILLSFLHCAERLTYLYDEKY